MLKDFVKRRKGLVLKSLAAIAMCSMLCGFTGNFKGKVYACGGMQDADFSYTVTVTSYDYEYNDNGTSTTDKKLEFWVPIDTKVQAEAKLVTTETRGRMSDDSFGISFTSNSLGITTSNVKYQSVKSGMFDPTYHGAVGTFVFPATSKAGDYTSTAYFDLNGTNLGNFDILVHVCEHEEFENCQDGECSVCGFTRETPAHYSTSEELFHDDTYHFYKCDYCEAYFGQVEHVYDSDCDTTCNECGYVRTDTAAHSCDTYVNTDAAQHWKICTECGEKFATENHSWASECDTTCDVCGYTRTGTPAHTSSIYIY